MSGKGSKPRPFSVDQQTFDDNWDRIFNKKNWDHYSDLPNPNAYESKENVDALEDYRKQAQELWSDSCTTPRKQN